MIDPMCSNGVKPGTKLHYLFRCDLHSTYRLDLLYYIYTLNSSFKDYSEDSFYKYIWKADGKSDTTPQKCSFVAKFTWL